MSVIAVLLSLMSTALSGAFGAARGVKCEASLRAVVMDFRAFADASYHTDRGDDARRTDGRFRLATFQDSEYGVDEFWRWGDASMVVMPDLQGDDPMRCAAVEGAITLRRGIECTDGAVSPSQRISYGLNRRLHRAEVVDSLGRPRVLSVLLSSDVLNESLVPLVWDVDGEGALERKTIPVFSAPALDSRGAYANDRFWFPAMRHNGAMNVGFLDGHVASTRRPLEEPGWRWDFQPPVQ